MLSVRPAPALPAAAAALALTGVAFTAPAAASAAGPSRAVAQSYAHRSYVVDGTLGKRHFALTGPKAVARGSDGSTITAFGLVLADSGDGTGQAVLLFRGTRFLGWASDRLQLHLRVTGSGRAISVKYGAYSGDDPFCCPSKTKTVHYRWRAGRIVADAAPPLIYGKRGTKIHLSS
ncbi:MAG TPA: LppP/LprE family lipoprotein [Baekduia sp.]|uniref:LppP/LprE family lipoprotein n=1 Tax=Baekduia sp. TaxID=2600305 RepID=UPI002D794425|nr:LppP/LprE family lipoprotein [Baekduia sp.]HET6506451.1 LppP/LprE family lipoprotein [Baekduia sp.]